MAHPETRTCVLTLCLADGTVLGDTGHLQVPSPYLPEAAPVVNVASAALSAPVRVLRLLEWESMPDGIPDLVRYLAEVAEPVSGLTATTAVLAPDSPLRMPWARPGGPERQLDWARHALASQGRALRGSPVQVRTWNLSSLWRLPTDAGDVWLKAVPKFFAHEAAVLQRLERYPVPQVVASAEGIVLLEAIPGADLYDASLPQAMRMVDLLMDIQRGFAGAEGELLELGLPDWRLPKLAEPAARALDQGGASLEQHERRTLDALVAGLDDRGAALMACGIPDSLVHGDFHPGNVRGDEHGMTLLDWGDSGYGHPLLDATAFTERMPQADGAAVLAHWAEAWAEAVPGSDAARAVDLLAPVAALRQATLYQGFVDRIEPDERVYHRDDVPIWLRRAAALA